MVPGDPDALPSVVDDPPGRAIMAIRPDIAPLNIGVDDWSAIRILLWGADGRWRRLDLGELGLDDADIYQDTYGAGRLSSPGGRWWMGPTRDGLVLLDLRTGDVRELSVGGTGVGAAVWVPGTHSIAVDGRRIDVVSGDVVRTPYRSPGEVGFAPDGTPLFLDAGPDGEATLYEWRGARKVARIRLPRLEPPPRRGPSLGVAATEGLVAVAQRGTVVVEASTGDTVGVLRYGAGTLVDATHWIDEHTLLVARGRQLLAWRPVTGRLFRVADAPGLGDYWDLDLVPSSR